MEFGIERYAMLMIKLEKETNNEEIRTAKSRRIRKLVKGKLQVFRNIGSGKHPGWGKERKKMKSTLCEQENCWVFFF